MKSFIIFSKANGPKEVLVDDEDEQIVTDAGNASGKWCVVKKRNGFYAGKRFPDGKYYELHRVILGFPKGYVDHINRNSLDNRKSNLRVVSNAANLRNGRVRPQNTSGVTGVSWSSERKKWCAYIRVKYKVIPLGRFADFDEAVSARMFAESYFWDE